MSAQLPTTFSPSLSLVRITKDCYSSCLTHALTSSEEEIMGLLLGFIDTERGVSTIWTNCPLRRMDKRRDRVEISPEQLVLASSMAEKLTIEDKLPTRVVGWYHSHPQFIHLPSPIDLNCQAQYQQMDSGFIGLIFSVFNQDKANIGNIKLHAFQSQSANAAGIEKQLENLSMSSSVDLEDLKTMAMNDQSLVSVSVPLELIDNGPYPRHSLERIVRLQELVVEEERDEYNKFSKVNEPEPSYLMEIHNSGIYQAHLINLLESCVDPLNEQLKNELKRNNEEISRLEALIKAKEH